MSNDGRDIGTLPYPIKIDSGACASVIPTSWCSHVPIKETLQSQAGEYFKAANGERIYHEGQRMIIMMTQEGATRHMRFTVCGVSKALGSVSQMCRAGRRVVVNPPWGPNGSYIEHIETGDCMWMEEQAGLYVLKTNVAPSQRQTEIAAAMRQTRGRWRNNIKDQGFARQVRP